MSTVARWNLHPSQPSVAPVIVRSKAPLGPLTPEDQLLLLEAALSTRFAGALHGLQPEARKQAVQALARQTMDRMNRCAQAHLLHDGAALMQLTPASEDECRAIEALVSESVQFQVDPTLKIGPSFGQSIKHAVGVIWSKVFTAVGGNDRWDEPASSSGPGVRG